MSQGKLASDWESEASAPPGDGEWDVINEAVKGQTIQLGGEGTLALKVTWDGHKPGARGSVPPGQPDVDISAICFSSDGTAQEAIFFNHPVSVNRSILLTSGDQSSGTLGEELNLRLLSILPNSQVICIVVSSANEVPITSVAGLVVSANLRNTPPGNPFRCDHITWQQPSSPTGGAPTTTFLTVPFFLRRDGSTKSWTLNVTAEHIPRATGFMEALPALRNIAGLPQATSMKFQIPVVLEKDENVVIHTSGDGLLHVGCGWDPVDGKETDADLSALIVGGADGKSLEDVVYWGKLTAFDGAILHSGDNRTGDGDGDDESIIVNLNVLPNSVKAIFFVVSNFNGAAGGAPPTLENIRNAHFRVVRHSDGAELVHFNGLGEGASHSAVVTTSVSRLETASATARAGGSGSWKLSNHCVPVKAETLHDATMMKVVQILTDDLRNGRGPSIKPVNLRKALKHVNNGTEGKGKTAADLPVDPSDIVKSSSASGSTTSVVDSGTGSVSRAQQQQQQPPAAQQGSFRAAFFWFVITVVVAYLSIPWLNGTSSGNNHNGRHARR